MMVKIIMVLLGGGLGALVRYGFALMAARIFSGHFPWGTLMANLLGCFLIGAAFALAGQTSILSPSARLFFMTGFLGALTTFSTFALETVTAARSGAHSMAVINFLVNNVAGAILVLAGMTLVQVWLKGK